MSCQYSNERRKNVQLIFCTLGIMLSAYAYYVETSKHRDSSYSALCDINSSISCSKVFMSKWGTGMGLLGDVLGDDHFLNQPNSVYGIAAYLMIIGLELSTSLTAARVELLISTLSVLSCVWLAYILFFVLQDICIVCCSMYVINTVLLVGTVIRYTSWKVVQPTKKRQ